MASRLPTVIPGEGAPNTFYLSSILEYGGISLILTIVGLVIGSLYYQGVAEAALSKQVNWISVLEKMAACDPCRSFSWPFYGLSCLLLSAYRQAALSLLS
jgi:hypothetical protein